MEQPYPPGYTGHVSKVRRVVGQTYGTQVREAINSVTPPVELAKYSPHVLSVNPSGGIPSGGTAAESTVSTQQLSYQPPEQVVDTIMDRAAKAKSIRVPVDTASRYASSSQLCFKPPPAACYATPGWSERPTSNIGQPDVFKHAKKLTVHQPTLPRALSGGSVGSSKMSSLIG